MPGPTTESLDADVKELRRDVQAVAVDVAGLKAEFNVFKWLMGLVLALAITGLASSVWWAATLNARVGTLEGRFDKFDARLDRMEAGIAKAIGQATKEGQTTPR